MKDFWHEPHDIIYIEATRPVRAARRGGVDGEPRWSMLILQHVLFYA
jgi:hypothetical protein